MVEGTNVSLSRRENWPVKFKHCVKFWDSPLPLNPHVTQMLSLSLCTFPCVLSLLLPLLCGLLTLYSNDPQTCRLLRFLGPYLTHQSGMWLNIPGESWESGVTLLFLPPLQELANFSSKGPEEIFYICWDVQPSSAYFFKNPVNHENHSQPPGLDQAAEVCQLLLNPIASPDP